MSAELPGPLALLASEPGEAPGPEEMKACCASVYEHPAVRWLLGGELHPGGEATTRRALDLIAPDPGERLLDVASGTGASALLAAREFGVEVVGVEYSEAAVIDAGKAAEAAGLGDQVSFVLGDAEALALPDGSFDAVLCECAMCTFPGKAQAAAEIARVLRPGGMVAISDVIVDAERLPEALRGPMADVACVGSALSRDGYEELLGGAGLEVFAVEPRHEDVARLARRVEERLRGARLLGAGRFEGFPLSIEDAIDAAGLARRAIEEGSLSYAILAASAR